MTGKELNAWRKKMGWTVAETARQFMVPQSTLRDWIYDKRRTVPGYVVALTAFIYLTKQHGRRSDYGDSPPDRHGSKKPGLGPRLFVAPQDG